MLPSDLRKEDFVRYPPEARDLAARELDLLRSLPLAFLPLLLRELLIYDWKFPVERNELLHQFAYLHAMSPIQLQQTMAPFEALHLTKPLEELDWVNTPAVFSEQLSAHLWASHQIDAFRTASIEYVRKLNASSPKAELPVDRLAIVLVGAQVGENTYPLFRKLRSHGTYFSNVQPEKGLDQILALLEYRASGNPSPFAHWYVDGDVVIRSNPNWACVSYKSLAPVRTALLDKIYRWMQPGGGGPEYARTALAQIKPEDVGLPGSGDAGLLNRFQLSMLTEGSGTQIFSTTFVQWTGRELLRRAQPLTLLLRFTPRQHEDSTSAASSRVRVDPAGSLIDADMGAYYTWVNLQRLSGSDRSRFLVWFEGRNEAVIIAPQIAQARIENASVTMADLLQKIP